MTFDAINASFEFIGGVMLWLNVRQVLRDKQVHGVNAWSTAFFTLWGYWNILYYPGLNQWLSMLGGLVIVAANTTWVVLLFKYRRRKHEH